ncbi:MAG: alpha/beta fold hydrolase [Varibaculum timonense]|uniref:alpha/beta fold hydrolase n=1 Tax=Varibaculum timonense TaxID=1964383 RepID=UPI000931BAB0|nr:alpha/beta hydrolase [Varibaculum timonense]
MQIQIGTSAPAQPTPLIWLEAGLGGSMQSWNLTFPILCRAFYCARSTRSTILNPGESENVSWRSLVTEMREGGEETALHLGATFSNPLPVILVGHSYGAMLVRVWAAQILKSSSPSRIRPVGIVQIDPSFEGNNEGAGPLYQKLEQKLLTWLYQGAAREQPSFYMAWKDLQEIDLLDDQLPQLVISAAHRKGGKTWKGLKAFARAIDARLVRADSSRHLLQVFDPVTVASQIIEFTAQIGAEMNRKAN